MEPTEPPHPDSPAAKAPGAPPASSSVRIGAAIVLGFLVVAIAGVAIFFYTEQARLKSESRETEVVPALPPVAGPPSSPPAAEPAEPTPANESAEPTPASEPAEPSPATTP